MSEHEQLFTTRWVHVFEEDTPEGAVYRPEDDNIPLSRRPRERLELSADGTAKIIMPGPDDRLVEKPATWASGEKSEKETAAAASSSSSAAAAGAADIRIVKQSPSRLIIRRGTKADPV